MTVIFRAGTKGYKNDNQREITHRQHKVELQFLGTALLNIATNKQTKFQVFPPSDHKVLLQTSKKCYKIQEDHDGAISLTWVLRSTG